MYAYKISLILISFILLAGCAKSTFVIKEKQFMPFKEFSQITKVNSQTREFQIAQIIDNRQSQESLGVARTGVKYKETPIQTAQNLNVFLLDYFSKELNLRGLNVVTDASDYQMTIKINDLWLEEIADKAPEVVQCRVNFTFEIQGNNKSWTGNFWNEIVSPGDLGDGTTKIAPTMASCLNQISEKLVKSQKFLEFINI